MYVCIFKGFVDPFSIAGVFIGKDFFLEYHGLCHVIGSVCLISCVCSLWSIAAISVNRFVMLCRRALYYRIFSWSRSIYITLVLWLLAALLDLPNFLGWGDHTFDMKTMACSYDRLANHSYTVFFITMFVTVPLLTVLYCNINIFIVAVRSRRRVAAHIDNDLGTTGVYTITKQSLNGAESAGALSTPCDTTVSCFK